MGKRKLNASQEFWRVHGDWYKSRIDIPLLRSQVSYMGHAPAYATPYRYAMADFAALSSVEQTVYRDSSSKQPGYVMKAHRVRRDNTVISQNSPRANGSQTAETERAFEHTDFLRSAQEDGTIPFGPLPVIGGDSLQTTPAFASTMTPTNRPHIFVHGRRIPGRIRHPSSHKNARTDVEWTFLEDIMGPEARGQCTLSFQKWRHNTTGEIMIIKHLYAGASAANFAYFPRWHHTIAAFPAEAYYHHHLSSLTPANRALGTLPYAGCDVDYKRHVLRIGMEWARYGDIDTLIVRRSISADAYEYQDELSTLITDAINVGGALSNRLTTAWQSSGVSTGGSKNDSLAPEYLSDEWLETLDLLSQFDGDIARRFRELLRRQLLPEDFIWAILRRMTETLFELSISVNALHGDIKPANIFIKDCQPGPDSYGWCIEPRLADFGATFNMADTRGPRFMFGTTGYKSPELMASGPNGVYAPGQDFIGGHTVPKSDVYSLGCVLWALMDPHLSIGEPMVYDTIQHRYIRLESNYLAPTHVLRFLDPVGRYSNHLVTTVRACLDPNLATRYDHAALINAFDTYDATRPAANVPPADGGRAMFPEILCNRFCRRAYKDCICWEC